MKYLIEFEGFALGSKFIFKEVSIVNVTTKKITTYFLKSPYPRKYLASKDKSIVAFCETHLHKINWESGIHRMRDLKQYISKIGFGDIVYTKGLQKAQTLKTLFSGSCCVVDLEEIGCQCVSVYLKNISVNQCIRKFHNNSEHCSYLKAQAYLSFLLQDESVTREEH